MRQTLLRIVNGDLFSIQWDGDIPLIGPGFILLPWIAYGLYWWMNSRSPELKENVVPVILWLVMSGALLSLPSFLQNGVPIYGYGFFFLIGFIVGGWTATRRAEAVGLNGEILWDLGLWVFFGGVVGARIFYCIEYPARVFMDSNGQWKSGFDLVFSFVNLSEGGLVFYGGMILGAAGFIAFCVRRKLSPHLLADVAIPSVFIGLGFGRLGCLMNGCCYGDRCDLPWGITFKSGSVPFEALVHRGFLDANDAITFLLHPTQIYSSINAFLLAWLTASYFKHRPRDGAVVALGMLIYPVTRFIIEILRSDESGILQTRFTISQAVSGGLFLAAVGYTAYLHFVVPPQLTLRKSSE